MDQKTIETHLRKAPRVRVPVGLRQKLEADIALPRPNHRTSTESSGVNLVFWLRRWIPALGLATWILGGLVVLGLQSEMITRLREEQSRLSRAAAEAASAGSAASIDAAALSAQVEQLRKDAADRQRLTAEAERLRAVLETIPALRAANEQLRAELRPQTAPPPAPEEDIFAVSRSKAQKIACINNLKQVGLAARIWANERSRRGEPEVLPTDYESMQRELSSEKVTFCPADQTTRYEILSPGADAREPNVVYVRCPIHNNVGLVDGSVQALGDKRHVVQQNGKWVMPAVPAP